MAVRKKKVAVKVNVKGKVRVGKPPASPSVERIPNELVARFLMDTSFRQRLLKDPKNVAAAEGFHLGPATLERIARLDRTRVDAIVQDVTDHVSMC